MFKNTARAFLLVLILLAVAIATPAQTGADSLAQQPNRMMPTIESASLLPDNTLVPTTWTLLISGFWENSCDYPVVIEQDYADGWLIIEF